MLTLREILRRTQTGDGEAQINEAVNELPALLVLKRGAIRTLSDGRKRGGPICLHRFPGFLSEVSALG